MPLTSDLTYWDTFNGNVWETFKLWGKRKLVVRPGNLSGNKAESRTEVGKEIFEKFSFVSDYFVEISCFTQISKIFQKSLRKSF